jgi:hypothetical protein
MTNHSGGAQPLRDLSNYSTWLALQDAPWSPPTSLEAALRKIEELPVIWLNEAVDTMAFGVEEASSDRMEFAARRCQASRALCEAARLDAINAIGNPDRPGDGSEPVPRAYFDIPRQLGSADNSFETALDKVSTDEFMVATSGGHQKWFNVRIEISGFLAYLKSYVSARDLDLPVQPYMIEAMTRPESAGYVPLCSALLWIMTDAGSTKKSLQDTASWQAAVARLLPLISTGEIEVIGRPGTGGAPKVIEGNVFAGILISPPLHDSIDVLTGDDPWISPTPFVSHEYWANGFNDQLFLYRATSAAWSHLQVKKSDVLREIRLPELKEPVAKQVENAPAKRALKSELEAAYKLRVEEFKGKKPPSRKEDEQYLREEYGIGRDRARELRAKFAPPEWQAKGRRKSGA